MKISANDFKIKDIVVYFNDRNDIKNFGKWCDENNIKWYKLIILLNVLTYICFYLL